MTDLLRCAECRFQGQMRQWVNYRCPSCGAQTPPFDPDRDLILIGAGQGDYSAEGPWVRVSWGELRVLSQWARFWAEYKKHENGEASSWMLRTVDAITFNLKRTGGGAALTVADDLEQARRISPNAKFVRNDGSEIILEPGWLNRAPSEEASVNPVCPICHSRHAASAAHSTVGE